MVRWHIGCSGFQYRHWKNVFYPEKLAQKNWFLYYASHYDTLELNVTFYRFPDAKIVKGWYDKSPEHFVFTVKAPRIITHYKKLNETEALIGDFYNVLGAGFKEKLGCVLFQFPPSFHYSEELLNKVTKALDPAFKNVVEFRHKSWWNEDVYNCLGEKGITFCGMSHPQLPDEIIHNSKILYYRMHGVPHLYRSPYAIERLRVIKETISRYENLEEVYIYFNNDIEGSAIKNSKELKEMLL